MPDGTGQTASVDDNLLGLTTREAINEAKVEGFLRAELIFFSVEEDAGLSVSLLLLIHRTAFGQLYEWAGKWRKMDVNVGRLNPPAFYNVPTLMYQFIDELNYRLTSVTSADKLLDVLAWSHHQFVWIHSFTNGNGRTARLLTNLILLLSQNAPIRLYHREGESRNLYISALRLADEGNYPPLKRLISREFRPL